MNPDVAARVHGVEGPPVPTTAVEDPPVPTTAGDASGDALALQRLRADIISHDSVPSAPIVLLEIFRVIDDDGDLHRLFTAIERDGGLTARILRMANSSFFGQSRTVGTVERAVLVLGVAMVRSLAVSAAVFEAVGNGLPAVQVDLIWRHSLATGMAARALAARTGIGDHDEAFTAGLLHETGRMLLARRFPEFYRALPPAGTMLVEVEERAVLGVDHAIVGGWLFDSWQLPRAIVDAVAQHHASAPSPGLPTSVAAANLLTRYPDGSVLLADATDPHAAAARAAAAACSLTPESWAEVAAGPRGGARS